MYFRSHTSVVLIFFYVRSQKVLFFGYESRSCAKFYGLAYSCAIRVPQRLGFSSHVSVNFTLLCLQWRNVFSSVLPLFSHFTLHLDDYTTCVYREAFPFLVYLFFLCATWITRENFSRP